MVETDRNWISFAINQIVVNAIKYSKDEEVESKHIIFDITEDTSKIILSIKDEGIKKVYLSAILDLYDRSVVSYVLSNRNDNKLVFDTYDLALESNPDGKPLFHSDRGRFNF